jgi:hypothetical protein
VRCDKISDWTNFNPMMELIKVVIKHSPEISGSLNTKIPKNCSTAPIRPDGISSSYNVCEGFIK